MFDVSSFPIVIIQTVGTKHVIIIHTTTYYNYNYNYNDNDCCDICYAYCCDDYDDYDDHDY